MELKVWVEGIQRIVCGVTETTSCQDVVYALAHATGKTGRFTLLEKWRNNERLLAPNENPLKVLLKWGEYSNDVQFILQHSPIDVPLPPLPSPTTRLKGPSPKGGAMSHPLGTQRLTSPTSCITKDIKKSLTFSGGRHNDVSVHNNKPAALTPPWRPIAPPPYDMVRGTPPFPLPSRLPPPPFINGTSPIRQLPPYRPPPPPPSKTSPSAHNLHHSQSTTRPSNFDPHSQSHPQISQSVHPSSQNPQQPQSQHPQAHTSDISHSGINTSEYVVSSLKEFKQHFTNGNRNISASPKKEVPNGDFVSTSKLERVVVDEKYLDLIALINSQKEELNQQQIMLTKHEAEMNYFEVNNSAEENRLVFVKSEIERNEQLLQELDLELNKMENLENDFEMARKHEENCLSKLSQLKNETKQCEIQLENHRMKIRNLEKDFDGENSRREKLLKIEEIAIVREVEKLLVAVKESANQAEGAHMASVALGNEMNELGNEINDRKMELDHLMAELKKVNLESLSLASIDDRNSSEGTKSVGRKMFGSPRQLETAVPTSKNPHGIWV